MNEDGDAAVPARGWLRVCGALAAGSIVTWWLPAALLDWQPARALDDPWRFVTAAWVHWHEWHLAANLAGCAVVAWLGVAARLPNAAACAFVAAWPLTHAGLLLQPALAHYGGASGVLHAAVAVAACWLMVEGRGGEAASSRVIWIRHPSHKNPSGLSLSKPLAAPSKGGASTSSARTVLQERTRLGIRRHARFIGAAIAAGLVAKVLLEKPWSGPLAAEPAWGIAVAVAAHASGAVAGAVAALVALGMRGSLRSWGP